MAGLTLAARPALRWYGAQRPALVLGSGQRPSEVDAAAALRSGIDVHKRGSGGGAVLFGPPLLMQDLVLPIGHALYQQDVSESYRWLGEVWAAALVELGVTTELVSVAEARVDPRQSDPLVRRACFGGRSPYEVLANGRKLVGFAQTRRRQGALFQVGLYRHWTGSELVELLRLSPTERVATRTALAERVVGLDELLPDPPSLATLAAAFEAALQRLHSSTTTPAAWQPDEVAAAQAAAARFAPLEPDATFQLAPSS